MHVYIAALLQHSYDHCIYFLRNLRVHSFWNWRCLLMSFMVSLPALCSC